MKQSSVVKIKSTGSAQRSPKCSLEHGYIDLYNMGSHGSEILRYFGTAIDAIADACAKNADGCATIVYKISESHWHEGNKTVKTQIRNVVVMA